MTNTVKSAYKTLTLAEKVAVMRAVEKGLKKKSEIGGDFTLWLLKPDGTEKQLAKYDGIPIRIVSKSNDFISVCTNGSKVTFTQFEDDGDVKLTLTMPDINKNIKPISVLNLPEIAIELKIPRIIIFISE